ncbi:hypothetical protein Tco_1269058 [Tanacetum coccineum]
MVSYITRFDIEKFDVNNDFGLWQIKMCALMILDLANIDIEIEDEDQTLILLTSLPSSYKNFVETLLYGRESLTMEDVLSTLNSRDLMKISEGTKEETGDGLYVKGMSDHLEGYLKRDYPMKKSSGFIKKGKRDQDYDSSNDEGKAYFGEALVVVENDEMTELVMDSGTLEKEGYTMKMQMGRIKHGGSKQVGLKKLGSKQVGFKQLGHKQVGFKQLGLGVKTGVHGVRDEKRVWFKVELQGAQEDREAEVFQVSNDDDAVAKRRLEDKQIEEKKNTECLVKEQEKVHLGMKVGANIMVTGVLGQEGA